VSKYQKKGEQPAAFALHSFMLGGDLLDENEMNKKFVVSRFRSVLDLPQPARFVAPPRRELLFDSVCIGAGVRADAQSRRRT
jgi:hypothetical protein